MLITRNLKKKHFKVAVEKVCITLFKQKSRFPIPLFTGDHCMYYLTVGSAIIKLFVRSSFGIIRCDTSAGRVVYSAYIS